MIVIFMLTLRQIANQKRTLLMLLFAALPVTIAIIYRISTNEFDRVEFVANGLLSGLVVAIVLPLTALIFGTAALGAEIEDGTVVYPEQASSRHSPSPWSSARLFIVAGSSCSAC